LLTHIAVDIHRIDAVPILMVSFSSGGFSILAGFRFIEYRDVRFQYALCRIAK